MANFTDFFDVEEITIDDTRKQFIDNMDMLKGMSVQEFTLYKKYKEVNQHYRNRVDAARVTKAKIWKPTDILNKEQTITEINNLDPVIRFVVPKSPLEIDWLMLRVFSHTMEFDQNPGRFLRFMVMDRVTDKLLGAVSLGSDVISISCRDQWIGWDKATRHGGKLKNSAIGTCIMATQPFGYNFLGGKLVASLLTDKEVSDTWYRLYGDVLAGLTTTSLYGSNSMYNSIPFWKKLGKSKGLISIKPDDAVYQLWHEFVKREMTEEYNRKITAKDSSHGPVTGVKQQILSMIYKAVGIKASTYNHGFERGVYYAPLYENTKEFLRGDIEAEKLVPLEKLKGDAVVNWWKPKAIARYESLLAEGNLKPDILYYSSMLGMSWAEAKVTYLSEVGR